MKRFLTAAVLAAAVAVPAVPAHAADVYTIDKGHSEVSFQVRHLVTNVRGRFNDFAGTVNLDPANLANSTVEFTIQATSIDTGVADRDNHLRSADFFDVETFPTLRFTSTKVEKAGDDRYRVHGDITIRDVTKAIVLDAEYGGQGKDPWGNQRVAFSASTSLSRGEFGLKWNQALEAGGVLVGDKIDIEVEVQAVSAG